MSSCNYLPFTEEEMETQRREVIDHISQHKYKVEPEFDSSSIYFQVTFMHQRSEVVQEGVPGQCSQFCLGFVSSQNLGVLR